MGTSASRQEGGQVRVRAGTNEHERWAGASGDKCKHRHERGGDHVPPTTILDIFFKCILYFLKLYLLHLRRETRGYQWYRGFRLIPPNPRYGTGIPGCGYGFWRYGYGVGKADPQYTHIKPYLWPCCLSHSCC